MTSPRRIPHSHPCVGAAERRAVLRVLASGHLGRGPECAALERALAELAGHRHAIAVQSGTQALHLALVALGVAPDDEVVLPSYVCTALLNAVRYVGARAVLVDADGENWNPSLEALRGALSRRTRAVIVAHTLGAPAPVRALRAHCAAPIIEDCAMALGGRVDGRPFGGWGTLAVGSLYATKYLTSAHGGFVATSDDALAARLADLVDFDNRRDYRVRYNARLSDLQAALGREQVRRAPAFFAARRRIARRYQRAFAALPVTLPVDEPERPHAFFRYCVAVAGRRRAALMRHMAAAGIECKPPVFRPLHRYMRDDRARFPAAEAAHQRLLSLPCYPGLSPADQSLIIRRITSFFD